MGGLTLADLLRQDARAEPSRRPKSIIYVVLGGGPSHIDMYDLKPDAPSEYRGPFTPIATRLPGVRICELMPRQAEMMNRLTLLRGIRSVENDHFLTEVYSGLPRRASAGVRLDRQPVRGERAAADSGRAPPGPPPLLLLPLPLPRAATGADSRRAHGRTGGAPLTARRKRRPTGYPPPRPSDLPRDAALLAARRGPQRRVAAAVQKSSRLVFRFCE